MDFGYKTDMGLMRDLNEDSFLFSVEKDYVLMAIADGMGGHNAGEIASGLAISVVKDYNSNIGFSKDILKHLNDCVKSANKKIYEESLKLSEYGGMGTTLIVAVIKDNHYYIAHVGDSRAYIINNNIKKITIDHSYVEELKRLGKISDEEAKTHPNRNHITRAVGTEKEVVVDCYDDKISSSDLFLICSDGLTNMLEEKDILDIVKSSDSVKDSIDRLVSAANEKGGADNITIIGFKSGSENASIGGEKL